MTGSVDTSGDRTETRSVRGLGHDTASLVERVVASEDSLAEASAEVIVLDVGRVIRQRAFPHVFDANVVRHPRLEGVALEPALERLAAPLREVGARHLQIAGDAGGIGDVLAADLRHRGFVRDRLLAMVLAGAPARAPVAGVELRAVPTEAPFGWYADIMDRTSREEPWYTTTVSREIVGSLESKMVAGALQLHVAVIDRRPVGAAGLTLGPGGVGSITTVGTIPEWRRRGVAQTLVVTLAERARVTCDLVYLIARADDTPREMYRKLGFQVGFAYDTWLLPPILS